MSTHEFTTRRDFLKGSADATGAVVIGFTLPMTSRFGQAAAPASGAAAKQSYLISARVANAPKPEEVTDWQGLFDQFDAREIFHVT